MKAYLILFLLVVGVLAGSCKREVDECLCQCELANGDQHDVIFDNENWLTNSDCDRHVGDNCVVVGEGDGTVASCN